MKIKWWYVVAVGLCLLVLVCSTWYFQTKGDTNRLGIVNTEAVRAVNKFHSGVKHLPVAKGKAEAQAALEIIRDNADECGKILNDCKSKTYAISGSSENSDRLRKSIASAIEYLDGVNDYSKQKISRQVVGQLGSSMLQDMKVSDAVCKEMESVKQANVTETLDHVVNLVKLATKPAPPPVTRVVYVNRYWDNPSYNDYRQEIAEIVAIYNAGRKSLSGVFTHYDNGTYAGYDQNQLWRAINQRRELLTRLQNLNGTIPSGEIYQRHHEVLKEMLTDAINYLVAFGDSQNPSTRQGVRSMSARNTAVMNQLKAFYNVR